MSMTLQQLNSVHCMKCRSLFVPTATGDCIVCGAVEGKLGVPANWHPEYLPPGEHSWNQDSLGHETYDHTGHLMYDGCEEAKSCLICPLERCKFEQGQGTFHKKVAARNEQMRAFHALKWGVKDIEKHFQVSRRQVLRAIKGEVINADLSDTRQGHL